jgi:hypothetical protein
MLRRKSFELKVLEGRMSNRSLQLAWSEEYGFLCIGKDNRELQKQQNKQNEVHGKSPAQLASVSIVCAELCIEALAGIK